MQFQILWPYSLNKSWWAVVLCDSVQVPTSLLRLVSSKLKKEILSLVTDLLSKYLAPALLFSLASASLLLQKLEEIFVGSLQGAGDDYLTVLTGVG